MRLSLIACRDKDSVYEHEMLPPPAAMDDGQGAVAAGFTVIGIGREGFLTDFLQRVTRMPAAEPVVQIRVGEPA